MEVDMAMVVKVLVSLCCVGVCVLGLYLSYIIWFVPQRVLGELRKQGIAGPRPSFPYGNLSDIREAAAVARAARTSSSSGPRRRWSPVDIRHDYRQAVLPFYEKWRKEYGAIFTYSMGNAVFLHVSRPDVVRDIGLCVSLDLGKSSYLKATHEPLFGAGILKSNGEAWAHQRKVIAPEFFLHKVKDMVGLMVDSAHAVVKSWEDRVERNGGTMGLKIDDDIRAYSADVISRACFGSSYIKGKEIFSLIRELQKAVSKPNLLAEMTGLRFIPTKSNQEAWRLHKQVHKLILDAVGESGEGKNLLHAILRSATGGVKGGRGQAETFVVDNCKSIYFAGYESTAVTAAWCLMLLGLHPEWQDRVRDEVQAACAGGPLDSQSLQKMKKLTMVIQETMRLYPAGAFVSRQALQDIELGGMRVPKGVNIYVPVSTVHLDREVWGPDAEEFRPERFADARPQLHSYLPFGAGARTCLGQAFAMAELKVLLALVLSKFVLKLSPEYVHSPTLRLIVEPEFGVHLTLNKVHAKGA